VSRHNDLYGWPHRRLRARVKRDVEAGLAFCARCLRPIAPWEPWDLDHDDADRTKYLGPSHRRCNRGAPARRGAPEPAQRTFWSRHWFGGYNPKSCRDCAALGGPCPLAICAHCAALEVACQRRADCPKAKATAEDNR